MATNPEIEHGKIVCAQSIIDRFSLIFNPLLSKANSTLAALNGRIQQIKTNAKYSDLRNVTTLYNYYHFKIASVCNHDLTELSAKLCKLEKEWKDVDSEWTSANPPQLETSSLHVLKPNVVAASGKVRKHDFIAAYNFKGFMESLYGIVSEMRNISFKLYENDEYKPTYSIGKGKFESYKTMDKCLTNTTDRSIYIDKDNGDISSNLFSFNEFILNKNTNGGSIKVPNDGAADSCDGNYGYTGSSLVPSSINEDMEKNSVYTNVNVNGSYNFGHQTARHYTKSSDDWANTENITSFYNSPSRTARQGTFKYESEPTCGIAKQYLTLKPAHTKPGSGNSYPTKFSTVENTITKYFNEQNPASTTERIVRSKNSLGTAAQIKNKKHKVIITASTVNNLFKELNKLAVKIKASLCGDYTLSLRTSDIAYYQSPRYGLAYPMMFSWYYGHKDSQMYLNRNTPKYFGYSSIPTGLAVWPSKQDGSGSRYLNSTINNGREIASEDFHLPWGDEDGDDGRNWPIRAGLPYMGPYTNNGNPYPLSQLTARCEQSHSSVVPMSFNRCGMNSSNSTSIFDAPTFLSNNSYNFKRQVMCESAGLGFPPNNGDNSFSTMRIRSFTGSYTGYDLAYDQFLNRYCIATPTNFKEFEIESSATSTYSGDNTGNSGVFNGRNVNTRYIFMPYMLWLNVLSASNNKAIFNGTIPSTDGTQQEVYISSGTSGTMNMAAGIPVLYEPRTHIWTQARVNETTAFLNINDTNKMNPAPSASSAFRGGRLGTCQLRFVKDDSTKEEYDIKESNVPTDWFEYIISCALTINEVNHTHSATSYVDFAIYKDNAHVASTSLGMAYGSRNETPGSSKKALSSTSDITSTIYYAWNQYSSGSLSNDHKNYGMMDMTTDMMNLMYGNRYKFNDFYEPYHSFTKHSINAGSIQHLFMCGGDNDYVQGNATKNFSWVNKVKGTCSNINFYLTSHINQETDYYANKGTPKSYNLAQGNFMANANYSQRVCIGGKMNKYYIVPQPSPVDVSTLNITYNGVTNPDSVPVLNMVGRCMYFWNNVKYIDINLKAKKGSGSKVLFTKKLHSKIYYNLNDTDNVTFAPTRAYQTYKLFDENDNECGHIEYDSTNKRQKIILTTPFPELLNFYGQAQDVSRTCECTMRITNENGGWRDICNNKNNPKIDSGYFPITVTYTPIDPDTPTQNLYSCSYLYDFNPVTRTFENKEAIITSTVTGAVSNIIVDITSQTTASAVIQHPATYYTESEIREHNDQLDGAITTSTELNSVQVDILNNLPGVSRNDYAVGDTPVESDVILYNDNLPGSWNSETEKTAPWDETVTSVITCDLTRISSNAFNNCSSTITSLTLPSTVTTIYNSAFGRCNVLEKVSMPIVEYKMSEVFPSSYTRISSFTINEDSTLNVITSQMFQGCSAMKRFDAPFTVDTVQASAFMNCTSMSGLSLQGISAIGNSAFRNCGNLTSIPLTNNVQSIGSYAFYGCSKITTVTIPNNITNVDTSTFENCSKVSTLSLPSVITSISSSAFRNCEKLSIINFPEQFVIEQIETSAFYDCSDLSSFIIPTTLESVGTNAFKNTKIKTLYYDRIMEPTEETTEQAVSRISALLENSGIDLAHVEFEDRNPPIKIEWSTNIVEDYGVAIIGRTPEPTGAVQIVSSVRRSDSWGEEKTFTVVGIDSGFSGYSELTSVEIPNTVKYLGTNAFDDCAASLYYNTNGYRFVDNWLLGFKDGQNETVKLGTYSSIRGIRNEAFAYTIITSFLTGNYLNKIAEGTCKNAEQLKTITIGSQVSSIEKNAFNGCKKLDNVTIPSNVKYIKDYAFSKCTDLETLSFEGEGATHLKSIGGYAFDGCKKISSITIPSEVSSIGECAFSDCSSMTSLSISNNVLTIGNSAFRNCLEIASLSLGNGLQEIGSSAFENCEKLQSITFANDSVLSNVPEYCFSNCTSLLEVNLPDSVKTLENCSFQYDTSLSSVNLNNVEEIGELVFDGCTSLSSITIPVTVKTIKRGAFSGCTSLESFTVDSENEIYVGQNGVLFSKVAGSLVQYPLGSTVTSYAIPETVDSTNITSIGSYAFFEEDDLVNITIPTSIQEIGESAFMNCTGLNGVYVYSLSDWCNIKFADYYANPLNCAHHLYLIGSETPISELVITDDITSIGDYAFIGCGDITSVTIPSTVVSIGTNAFYGCDSITSFIVDSNNPNYKSENGMLLTKDGTTLISGINVNTVSIPNNVNNVEKFAFSNCSNITSVTIPSTVTNIGESTFENCPSINKVNISNIDTWCKTTFTDISSNPLYSQNAKLYLNNHLVTDLSAVSYEVSSIGNYAFVNNKDFKNLIFSSYLNNIGNSSFSGCTELSSMFVPTSITSIGNKAFYGCTSLTTVNYSVDYSESDDEAAGRIQSLFSESGVDTEHVTFNPVRLRYSSNWFGNNAEYRGMNALYPNFTDSEFNARIKLSTDNNVDHFNWFVCNYHDYSSSHTNEKEYSIYGSALPTNIVKNEFSNRINTFMSSKMLDRIKQLKKRGYGIILWLAADDDGTRKDATTKEITADGWNRYLLTHWSRYCDDLRKLGFFNYADIVVVGLEVDEYWDTRYETTGTAPETAQIINTVRNYYNGKIGVHTGSLEINSADPIFKFYDNCDVCFIQTAPGTLNNNIKTISRNISNRFPQKNIYVFEIEREPARSKCEAILNFTKSDDDSTKFVCGVGNW